MKDLVITIGCFRHPKRLDIASYVVCYTRKINSAAVLNAKPFPRFLNGGMELRAKIVYLGNYVVFRA